MAPVLHTTTEDVAAAVCICIVIHTERRKSWVQKKWNKMS